MSSMTIESVDGKPTKEGSSSHISRNDADNLFEKLNICLPRIPIQMAATTSHEVLIRQLAVARNEIQNLRKQIRALSHEHQSDVKNIKDVLKDFKCPKCKQQTDTTSPAINKPTASNGVASRNIDPSKLVEFRPIGEIRTEFPEKRAVPRQPTVCTKLRGCIELNKDVFTNPEHSLEGLDEFSHLWIIYHFHKNDAHAKAKVAPPRLGGERIGIFSTRSPHRPCPIGLSLAEIDRIEGKNIYFYGTDMVDGTPVLDVKPYIPRYDNPFKSHFECRSISTEDEDNSFDAREEPDGEENIASNSNILTAPMRPMPGTSQSNRNVRLSGTMSETIEHGLVKVPNWVMAEASLDVQFNDRATEQIAELQVNRTNIVEVLKNDPRSVYLRTRYGSQIFTFQLGEVTVTCKFDDANATVTVVQIRKSTNLPTETDVTQ